MAAHGDDIFPAFLIFDCCSSLQTVCNFPHYNRIVSEIRNVLSGPVFSAGSFNLCWTRAHVGVVGNECAG